MDHEITIVHEDPACGFVSFGADRLISDFRQLFAYLVADGVVLSWVRTRTNEEVVRKAGHFFNVKNLDINGFFGLGGPESSQDLGGKGYGSITQLCSINYGLLSGRILH